MPELPEVDVTAHALHQRLSQSRVDAVTVADSRLRWPVTAGLEQLLPGQRIHSVGRRGKYLLWTLDRGILISHLGMSGSWRVLEAKLASPRERHDHIELRCGDLLARYHDPRRFGALLWHDTNTEGPILDHPLLAKLGIEPFDAAFNGHFLHAATRGKHSAIKTVLLSGQIVVGVGNIYASETLFAAQIHPETPAGAISLSRYQRLATAIQDILSRAIQVGGSSLRDFTHIDGVDGNFLAFARVYGREHQACSVCQSAIRRIVQGQRATYFCPRCQRRPRPQPV